MSDLHAVVCETLARAVKLHGEGSVLTLLQGLAKCHALCVESTQHGLFVKIHYSRGMREQRLTTKQILALDVLVPSSSNTRWPCGCVATPAPSFPPPSPPTRVLDDDWSIWAAEDEIQHECLIDESSHLSGESMGNAVSTVCNDGNDHFGVFWSQRGSLLEEWQCMGCSSDVAVALHSRDNSMNLEFETVVDWDVLAFHDPLQATKNDISQRTNLDLHALRSTLPETQTNSCDNKNTASDNVACNRAPTMQDFEELFAQMREEFRLQVASIGKSSDNTEHDPG